MASMARRGGQRTGMPHHTTGFHLTESQLTET